MAHCHTSGGTVGHPRGAVSKRAVDPAGLADTLAFGYPLGDKTLFCGMERLPAATMLRWANAGMQERRYWDARYATGSPLERGGPGGDPLRLQSERAGYGRGRWWQEPVSALSGGGDSWAILSALVAEASRLDTVTMLPRRRTWKLSMELARLVGAATISSKSAAKMWRRT